MANRERRNYEENVHLVLGFLRKKFNPDERPHCIRRIEKSPDDLLILKRELEVIGGHWRIHRTVNKRSTTKGFKKLQHYMIDHPDCAPYLDSIWKTVLLQPDCRAEKLFMLDVDFEWWDYSNVDIPLKNFLGVYKTEAEAIEMRNAIKQFVTSKIGEP